MQFSSDGVLSGKFAQPGTFFVSVSARDSGQPLLDDSNTFTINVGLVAHHADIAAVRNRQHQPHSAPLFSNGVAGAVTWSLDTAGNLLSAGCRSRMPAC